MSVFGLSSPGNLIMGEGAAEVFWRKAINCTKNTLRTRCRGLNAIFPRWRIAVYVMEKNRTFLGWMSSCLFCCFIFSSTGHSALQPRAANEVVLTHAILYAAFHGKCRLQTAQSPQIVERWRNVTRYLFQLRVYWVIPSFCDLFSLHCRLYSGIH